MRFALPLLCVFTCVIFLCVSVDAEESHLECSEGIPAFLKAVGTRNAVADMISKLLKCLEKTAATTMKTIMTIVKDVTACVGKFSPDMFKCLAKANVPNKVADIISSVLNTIKCIS